MRTRAISLTTSAVPGRNSIDLPSSAVAVSASIRAIKSLPTMAAMNLSRHAVRASAGMPHERDSEQSAAIYSVTELAKIW